MTTTRIIPASARDFDVYVDDQYIGSADQPTAAQQKADAYRFEQLRRSTAPTSPPALDLYAGVPHAHHTPSVAALARAYAHFRSHFTPTDNDHRLILEGAQRAFAALQERPYTVLPDGTVEMTGSKGDIYVVRDETCRLQGRTRTNKKTGHIEPVFCPSFQFHQKRHGGACYHVIARELLRLAQVLDSEHAAQVAAPTTPFVTLSGQLLGLAFSIARLSAQSVTLALEQRQLKICAGDGELVHGATVRCEEGEGQAAIRLSADAFGALWSEFRSVATSLDHVQLFIDSASAALVLGAESFSAQAEGEIITVVEGGRV